MLLLEILGEILGSAILEGVLALFVLLVKGLFQVVWSLFTVFAFIGRLMGGSNPAAHPKVQETPLPRP